MFMFRAWAVQLILQQLMTLDKCDLYTKAELIVNLAKTK